MSMQKLFIPQPNGPYKIGITKFHLVNASIIEDINSGQGHSFEVVVWYPSEEFNKKKATLYVGERDDKELFLLNTLLGSSNVKKFLTKEHSNSSAGIAISERKDSFPVIIFSRDIGYLPEYYTTLMEHLTSRGFIVFSIHHNYLPEEGNILLPSKVQALSSRMKIGNKFISILDGMGKFLPKKQSNTLQSLDYNKTLGNYIGEVKNSWLCDCKFLLEYLKSTNNQPRKWEFQNYDFFSSRLNFSNVILLGHGFGAIALQPLLSHPNVASFINLGADLPNLHATNKLLKPVLNLKYSLSNHLNESSFLTENHKEYLLKGMDHNSFTDLIFYQHIKNSFQLEEALISPNLIFHHIRDLIDSFLQTNLIPKSSFSTKEIIAK